MKKSILLLLLLPLSMAHAQRGVWQDQDGDGHPDSYHPLIDMTPDNCPNDFNPFQIPICESGETRRDARDVDTDGDGFVDGSDQDCPLFSSFLQVPQNHETDYDNFVPCREYHPEVDTDDPNGDPDSDGIVNSDDNNKLCFNPDGEPCANSIRSRPNDTDADGIPDSEDICPLVKNHYQEGICINDYDRDGIKDDVDPTPYSDPTIALNASDNGSQQQIDELERQLDSLRARYRDLVADSEQCTANYTDLGNRYDQLERDYQALRRERDDLQTQHQELRDQLRGQITVNQQLTTMVADHRRKIRRIDRLLAQMDVVSTPQRLRRQVRRVRQIVSQ